ncbi:hypothetical protein ACVMB1_006112 [Bradyrhizobium sp. USDA 4504]
MTWTDPCRRGKAQVPMTIVALIPIIGIIQKHAREMVSPELDPKGDAPMAVAKLLSYVNPRSRTERPRRTNGAPSYHLRIHSDEESDARAIIRSLPVKYRPTFSTAARCIGALGESLLAIAAWLVAEMLAGCAAYAQAMHGIPPAMHDEDANLSAPTGLPVKRQRPTLHLISHNIRLGDPVVPMEAQPGAVTQREARSTYVAGACSTQREAAP